MRSLAYAGVTQRAATMNALQAGVGNAAVMRMINASPHVCGPGCEHAPVPAIAFAGADRSGNMREIAGSTMVERRSFAIEVGVGQARLPPVPAVPATVASDGAGESQPSTPEEVPEPRATPAAGPPAGQQIPGGGEVPAASGSPTAEGAAGPASGRTEADSSPPAEGTVITIPDIVKPELEHIHACDSIAGIVPYNGSVVGGETPRSSSFGICRFGDVRVTGITITLKSRVYQVRGTIENRIKWGVQSLGRTDISGATDTDITATNYPTVASDLTPNMSSSGGRPPRTQFWAEDLTQRHELFHANDVRRQGPGAATSAVSWLSSQTASSVAGVQALVDQIPNRVVRTLVAGMGEPAEVRAYGDGAPSYRTRATAVKARGTSGGYATP